MKKPIVMDANTKYPAPPETKYDQYIIFEPHPDLEVWQECLLCGDVYVNDCEIASLHCIQDVNIRENWRNTVKYGSYRGEIYPIFNVTVGNTTFNVNRVVIRFDTPELGDKILNLTLTNIDKAGIEKANEYLQWVINDLQPYWKRIWNEIESNKTQ